MICKNCGAALPSGETVCKKCGANTESREKEAVKCNDCGKFFNKEFGMCPFCGAEPANEEAETAGEKAIPVATEADPPVAEEAGEGSVALCPQSDSAGNDELVSNKPQSAYNTAYGSFQSAKPARPKKTGMLLAVGAIVAVFIAVLFLFNGSLNKEKGVPTQQFEADIAELSYVKTGIFKHYTGGEYVLNEITVDKRQTNVEEKNDIIYCRVAISNEWYDVNLYVKLTYNLYNGDNWVLDEDEYISEECTSRPLQCVSMSELPEKLSFDVLNPLREYGGEHTIIRKNIQYIGDDNLLFCVVDPYTYKQTSYYKIVSYDGIFGADIYVDYYFHPQKGWEPITRDYFVENYKIQSAYLLKPDLIFGSFEKSGYVYEFLRFYNYNATGNKVDYTYTDKSGQSHSGTGTFDIYSMTVSNEEYTFYYSIAGEYWRLGKESGVFRKQE